MNVQKIINKGIPFLLTAAVSGWLAYWLCAVIESAKNLERWENTPTPYTDPYSDMSDIEKSKLIQLLMEQLEDQKRLLEDMRKREEESSRKNDALQQRLTELIDQNSRQISSLMDQICELTRLLNESKRENDKLKSRLNVANRNKYDSTSQKTVRSDKNKDDDNKPTAHTDAEAGFDGSAASLPKNLDVDTPDEVSAEDKAAQKEKEIRLYRQGKKYRTMKADNYVEHPSDT